MSGEPTTWLESMTEVLRWSGNEETAAEIHDTYLKHASSALGAHIEVHRTECQTAADQVAAAVWAASDEALNRVLLAPETTRRLFHQEDRVASNSRFLEDALTAESVIELSAKQPPGRELWTALGDVRVLPTGEMFRAPSVAGQIPLDLDSPYATSDDFPSGDLPSRCAVLSEGHRRVALNRVQAAYSVVDRAGLTRFVTTFTKVLVLTQNDGSGFSSGSADQHIGRSALRNAHSPTIDHLDVAEALVHEAIHALLYMQELRHRWVPTALSAPIPHVVSPWSARTLPLRPFLQACFIWYGVLHFWGRVMTTGLLPPSRCAGRMARAARGFRGPPLLDHVPQDERAAVSPVVCRAIAAMQCLVQDAFA